MAVNESWRLSVAAALADLNQDRRHTDSPPRQSRLPARQNA
jgi:hypothetical protein